jgi:hypothetical protein
MRILILCPTRNGTQTLGDGDGILDNIDGMMTTTEYDSEELNCESAVSANRVNYA